MPPQPIESRVTSLEQRMTELEQLPGRIDDLTSQVSQLRTKMDTEFSAVRTEIAEQGAASATRDEAIGIQMRVLHEDVISRFALLHDGLPARPNRKPRNKPLASRCSDRWDDASVVEHAKE
jgi:hypothetical protein